MTNLKRICAVITFVVAMILPVVAQNLTASQLNIYFGSPKKVVMTNSQGTSVTEFDRNGLVTKARQGNMSISYDWSDDGSEVTLSMYQGANLQDHGHIKIIENTPSRLKYDMGGMITMDITFKTNGALDKYIMTNPQMSATMTYLYNNEGDIFPYAIEQSAGNQSAKMSVTIDETDSCGNPTAYTQEFMGNKDVTKLTIEYY